MKSSSIIFYLALFNCALLFSQAKDSKKVLQTKRVVGAAPKIDGLLTDEAWKDAAIAKDFVMLQPSNGEPELETHKTTVKVLYDDNAIYISAMLIEPDPSKIAMEFTNRDNFGQTDFFLVTLNPNNDGLNATEFFVMSTGTQADATVSRGNEDASWSAVWKSAVKIQHNGWSVEMKIPYAALRFSNEKVQTWGVNFHRKSNAQNAQYTWNHIDNTKGIWTQYDGVLKGIENIKPPTRLSFYPYASTTASSYSGETTYNHSLGMDLKYGITENFTLDLTLIPDFGQAAFDDITLNLGPFEQRFSEQRQFFTEGTELFNKGDLFYSRRIGNRPVGYNAVSDNLDDQEEIIENPEKVNMLNAVKVSGRTKGGLGVGFFNAITEKTTATIKRNATADTAESFYKKTTEPFANYNVLVLDQQFNQNSSVSLVNTNVTREGEFRDANVTGLMYRLINPSNTYFIDGHLKMSNINEAGIINTGYSFDTSIAKISGEWQGELGYTFQDDTFDINDLGFQRRNNNQTIYSWIGYSSLKPIGNFNNLKASFYIRNQFLHTPGVYTGNFYRLRSFAMTRERLAFGLTLKGKMGKQKDFFEPRKPIKDQIYLERNSETELDGFISTDFRKKFAIDLGGSFKNINGTDQSEFGFKIEPRYRFSNQMLFIYGFNFYTAKNDIGFVADQNDAVIIGKRKSNSFENNLSSRYSFSTKSSLSLSFRHYWQTVAYNNEFYTLNAAGRLNGNNYTGDHDVNYNSWNLDLNYFWEFAPGSQLILFYRNSIFNENNASNLNFGTNLEDLFRQASTNTFSLKLVYFIDYNKLKNIF